MLDRERIELEEIAAANEGRLLVDAVIERAKETDSALHTHFTWDDGKAADSYRRQQARALIARIKIVVVNPDSVVVRAFVSLPEDRRAGGYTASATVLQSEELRQKLLDDIMRRISYWREQSLLWSSAEVRQALNSLERAIAQESASTVVNRGVAA